MQKYYEINENGSNIRCKLYYGSRPEAGRAVIFLPGFSGQRDNRTAARLAEKMLSKHRDTLLFLSVQQMIDDVGGTDVQSPDRIGHQEDGR